VSYSLGVDLGTTYSAAAVCEGGRARIVSLGHRALVVPSVVFLPGEGAVLVGEPAERRAALDPARVVREFKRRLGDPVPFVVGDSVLDAEALTGLLLRYLVSAVTEQQGRPPDRTVVTYPANWGSHKRERLSEAVAVAAAGETTTLTEPEAAAIWYAAEERVTVGERIAVYDLGGGTFDAAVLQKTETGFEILGTPQGVEHLGGIDVDAAIVAHVFHALGRDVAELTTEATLTAAHRLRAECVAAKEALSSDTAVTITVALPDVHADVRLTRAELEDMVRPMLHETVESLERAIRSAELAPQDIDRVLLVGGASRMPIVSEMVGHALARPSFVDAHPKHVVALGAALAADRSAVPVAVAAGGTPGAGAPGTEAAGAGDTPARPPLGDAAPAPPAQVVAVHRSRRGGRFRGRIAVGVACVAAVAAAALVVALGPLDGSDPARSTVETETPPVSGRPGGEVVDLSAFARGAPAHIDPALATTLAGAQVANALYDTLTEVDADDPAAPQILPQVAESYAVADGGSEWTFVVRRGLRFSNGEPVTPSSFVRGWERASDPELATEAATAFTYIEGGRDKLDGTADTIGGLEADDDAMELTVRLEQPNMGFDALVSLHIFAPMPEAVDELADQATWEDTVMVGNGPFTLAEARKPDTVSLVRNPEWDGTRYDAGLRLPAEPFLEQVTFRATASPEDGYQAFVAGEGSVAGVTFEQQREARDSYSNTFDVPFYSTFHLQIGWDDPVVGGPQNRLLRRAMSQAIDRAAVNQAEFLGTGLVAGGITPPGVPGYAEGVCEVCDYDPDGARADFEEWQAQGNRLTAPIRVQSSVEPGYSDPAVGIVVENLEAAGIDAVEEPLGQATYFERLSSGGCQVCVVAIFPAYLSYDSVLSDSFHGSASRTRNLGGFNDGTFDRLVEEARATPSADERATRFRDAEARLVNEEVAAIPLSWYPHPYVYADDIARFPVTNLGRIVWEMVSLEDP
jgi:ABC-type transport system substrate-binding protein/actin-like ATPase involved in cell morphogenesis